MTIALPSMTRVPAGERGITIGDFLVPITIGERISPRLRHLSLVLLGTLVIFLSAQVRFYLPDNPVPVTGQTFGVLLAGGALGFRRGLLAALLYLVLGLVGLPVFANGASGVAYVLSATGGYLVGFVVAAALVGRLAELGWDRHIGGSLGAVIIGNLVVYAVGLPWLTVVADLDVQTALAKGLVPFVVGDVLKLVAVAVLFPVAWWVVGRRPGER